MQQIIREAIVIDVDVKKQTCKLDYGDARLSEMSSDIPLPNMIGSGNNGLINIIKPNTRVLVAFIGPYGRQVASILSVLPSFSQQGSVSPSLGISSDLPHGSRKYPSIKDGEVILSSHSGPSLYLKEDRQMSLMDIYGKGISFNFNKESHSIESVSNNIIDFSSGGRSFFGEVRRNEKYFIYPDQNDLLNYSKNILEVTRPVGFFPNLPAENAPAGFKLRNPKLSEYRMIVNEFSSDSQFSSFEDELNRKNKKTEYSARTEKLNRYLDPTNLLGLARKELIEIISGNVIDINGLPLDINYRYIKMFGEEGKIIDDRSIMDAARRSRRGIGHHFQLNSGSFDDDKNISLKNFTFDIDKEGIFKLHVPKSTKTGNILYPIVADHALGVDNTIVVNAPANVSKKYPIPVMLRDDKNNPIPALSETHRSTGVRFLNNDGYFKSNNESSYVRINKTKYHNMYETAERLIANTIKAINIPTNYVQVNPDGTTKLIKDPDFLGYNYSSRSFERPEVDNKDLKFDYGFSTVSVASGNPPIQTGGDTYFAGKKTKDLQQSNRYTSIINGDKVSLSEDPSSTPGGGVSANMDFEGAIEVSVGSDDPDGKSITLDTAGSLVAWFGKDKNNRSLVVQTDGAALFNIGGSLDYSSEQNPILNKGRFDLRVNINDRGFYNEEEPPPITEAVGYSDYIISISEEGIVIAGGTKKPMLIRNKGEIMIESESTVSLYGKEINFMTPGREPVPFTKMSKNKQR
jgi:hypothetical protein